MIFMVKQRPFSLNILFDATIGAIPVIGQIFDFFFKANARNMKLMREHYLENVSNSMRTTNQLRFSLL